MNQKKYKLVVAIDFDGTLTDPKAVWPNTGAFQQDKLEILRALFKYPDQVVPVLWTCRRGKYLREAKRLLKKEGIVFKYVNKSPLGGHPKIIASLYIDDKNADWNMLAEKIRTVKN